LSEVLVEKGECLSLSPRKTNFAKPPFLEKREERKNAGGVGLGIKNLRVGRVLAYVTIGTNLKKEALE